MKGIAYIGKEANLCSFCDKTSKGSVLIKEGVINYCMQEHTHEENYEHLEPNLKSRSDYLIIDSNIQLKKPKGTD